MDPFADPFADCLELSDAALLELDQLAHPPPPPPSASSGVVALSAATAGTAASALTCSSTTAPAAPAAGVSIVGGSVAPAAIATAATAGGLNDAQRRAVEHDPTVPLLLIAGAGSGKTSTLCRRVGHLADRYYGSDLLVVTFTRNAAVELKQRLAKMFGDDRAAALQVSTFHSYCLKVCRQHADRMDGYTSDFHLISDTAQRDFVAEFLVHSVGAYEDILETEAPDVQRRIRGLLQEVGQAKAALKGPADLEPDLRELYQWLDMKLRSSNCMDYVDLVNRTLELFLTHPDVLKAHQPKHVLVDEAQDTSTAQLQLLFQLASSACGITVVGDDDQAIYRWGGQIGRGQRRESIDRGGEGSGDEGEQQRGHGACPTAVMGRGRMLCTFVIPLRTVR